MESRLYSQLDWMGIHAILESREDHPERILGPHLCSEGLLIQVYLPEAFQTEILTEGASYLMEKADPQGFFAVLLPYHEQIPYQIHVIWNDKSEQTLEDPYRFGRLITETDTIRRKAGTWYQSYEKIGAHPATLDGVSGTYFAVWAPGALRVSVVGDFNRWDGKRNPMRRVWDSGLFDLFLPGIKAGALYKYELKAMSGLTYLKADPCANAAELRPASASIVADLSGFIWKDADWMEKRKQIDFQTAPLAICEIHLGSFKKPEEGEFCNYRELAPLVADYVKASGYTAIELLPVMEHPLDASLGYQVTGYFAPTSRYGSPIDFMYFMNYLHEQEIAVILDWVPAQFPRDAFGLFAFDGTYLYEHKDPRQGSNPGQGTLLYNFGRPEVRNFLISNAMYWKEVFHADGLKVNAVSTILYLNHGKRDGEWIANIYGGVENLEGADFLRQLNTAVKKEKDGFLMIAEETVAWPRITDAVEKGGLGFDFKWNMDWTDALMEYMQLDPIFRARHHMELLDGSLSAFSERCILPLPHALSCSEKESLLGKLPGKRKNKFANQRALFSYMICHPGKKHFFMGQDFGQLHAWEEKEQLEWELTALPQHQELQHFFRELLHFYRTQPALYTRDWEEESMEWINSLEANENLLCFLRHGRNQADDLLIVCNFSPLAYEKHMVGVSYPGKYKEIFNSDREEFGGSGHINPRVKNAKAEPCDDRQYSITITIPPFGMAAFSCKEALQD